MKTPTQPRRESLVVPCAPEETNYKYSPRQSGTNDLKTSPRHIDLKESTISSTTTNTIISDTPISGDNEKSTNLPITNGTEIRSINNNDQIIPTETIGKHEDIPTNNNYDNTIKNHDITKHNGIPLGENSTLSIQNGVSEKEVKQMDCRNDEAKDQISEMDSKYAKQTLIQKDSGISMDSYESDRYISRQNSILEKQTSIDTDTNATETTRPESSRDQNGIEVVRKKTSNVVPSSQSESDKPPSDDDRRIETDSCKQPRPGDIARITSDIANIIGGVISSDDGIGIAQDSDIDDDLDATPQLESSFEYEWRFNRNLGNGNTSKLYTMSLSDDESCLLASLLYGYKLWKDIKPTRFI